MTVNERVRQLRKSLNLSQDEFGASIGLTKSGVSNIENGIRGVSDRHVKLLINSFNVNYDWLVYGDGEMFNQTDRRAYAIIDEILNGQNEFAKQVFMSFSNFDKRDWQTLEKLIDNIISMREKDKKNQEPDS